MSRLEHTRTSVEVEEEAPVASSSSIEKAEESQGGLPDGKVLGAIAFGIGLVALIAASAHYKGEIKHFLDFFIDLVSLLGTEMRNASCLLPQDVHRRRGFARTGRGFNSTS